MELPLTTSSADQSKRLPEPARYFFDAKRRVYVGQAESRDGSTNVYCWAQFGQCPTSGLPKHALYPQPDEGRSIGNNTLLRIDIGTVPLHLHGGVTFLQKAKEAAAVRWDHRADMKVISLNDINNMSNEEVRAAYLDTNADYNRTADDAIYEQMATILKDEHKLVRAPPVTIVKQMKRFAVREVAISNATPFDCSAWTSWVEAYAQSSDEEEDD